MRVHGFLLAPAAAALCAACSSVAPALEPIDDQVVAVGGELRLTLSASTSDGSRVSYDFTSSMPHAGDRAQLTERPDGTGVFVLRPLAADVGKWAFTFRASAGSLSDALTVQIEVKAAIGESTRPLFRAPLGDGTMLDLATQQCATINIEIDDADSTEVRIEMEEPRVANAEFTSRDRKKATVRWCPDANQKVSEDRVLLRFSADDGDNPKEIVNFAVVLKKPAEAGCRGSAPVVSHTPEDVETLASLELAAEVSDDVGVKGAPLLFYGKTDPGASPDLARLVQDGKLKQEEMTFVSGTAQHATYKAQLPNPATDIPVGAETDVYYLIVARDNDDPSGNCDHTTVTKAYRMQVTNPGGQGQLGVCAPCTHDIQCGGAADSCVRMGTGGDAFCARACTGASASECPSGYVCSPEPVRSVNDVQSRQCVPVAGSCGAAVQSCADDAREENDSRAEAQARPALAAGSYDGLISCPSYGSFSDEDWYRIELTGQSKVELALEGSRASDIDLDLFKGDGALLATSQGPESEEGITRTLPAGTYYVRAKAQTILGKTLVERNPYKLSYATGVPCVDDAFEDDDDLAHARPQPALWGFPVRGNRICDGDDDLFKVQLAEGENLIVDLAFTQSKPTENLDLHFLDARGNDLTPCSEDDPSGCSAFNGQGAGSNEHYEYYVPAEDHCAPLCTYYVLVHGWNGSENSYDLVLDVQE